MFYCRGEVGTNLLTLKSIAKAPRGAVNSMEITAIDNIMLPLAIPIARGMPPIAACTVAFGV